MLCQSTEYCRSAPPYILGIQAASPKPVLIYDAQWSKDQADQRPTQHHTESHEEAELSQGADDGYDVGEEGQSRCCSRHKRCPASTGISPDESVFNAVTMTCRVYPEVHIDEDYIAAKPYHQKDGEE
mmetsp:Transcript_57661/g.100132  ORF Transcript_57661/g.100132 Transcript_57661/m.100132 type:complete len:127 (-) Transcript_57661:182-562(-)